MLDLAIRGALSGGYVPQGGNAIAHIRIRCVAPETGGSALRAYPPYSHRFHSVL